MTRPRTTWPLLLLLSGCYWISQAERDARWDLDADGVERPADCDDDDPKVSKLGTYYPDVDEDGWGDSAQAVEACGAPKGTVARGGDCDDTLPGVHPEAQEVCDGRDNNCDGATDEGALVFTWYRDADEDGDGDPANAVEACARPMGYVPNSDDCDDTDPNRSTKATEVCSGVDDDCDGLVDDQDPSREESSATWYPDTDLDGYGVRVGAHYSCDDQGAGWARRLGDCAPDDPSVHPGADELCNGLDDDCDEDIDEQAIDRGLWFYDLDTDGFGDPNAPIKACEQPADTVVNGGDCDDTRAEVSPVAPELCADTLDNDCDTVIDEPECQQPDTAHTGDTGA